MRPRRGSRVTSSRGLTLMEVLVTLVLLSMLGGILWQALSQMARLERNVAEGGFDGQTDALRLQWVRTLLEAAQPLDSQDPDRFTGQAALIQGVSTDVPGWPVSFAAPFTLKLEHESATARSRLTLGVGRSRSIQSPPGVTIVEWTGPPGRFEFMAEDGTWHDRWPAQRLQPAARVLPALVAIHTGSPAGKLWVVQTRTSGTPRPTLRMLEQL